MALLAGGTGSATCLLVLGRVPRIAPREGFRRFPLCYALVPIGQRLGRSLDKRTGCKSRRRIAQGPLRACLRLRPRLDHESSAGGFPVRRRPGGFEPRWRAYQRRPRWAGTIDRSSALRLEECKV